METSTGAISEEKREPIAKAEGHEQPKVTSQWLYETFIVADETQVTRMQQIRELVKNGCDAFALKGACDNMVKLAAEKDHEAGIPAKVVNAKGKEVPNRGPKQAYAMNMRTLIQQAWGAMKFAQDELNKLGFTDNTGYGSMGPLAKQALAKRGIDWKGEKLAGDAEREKARLQREQKAESQVMAQAVIDNPKLPGESEGEWLARVSEGARDMAEAAREKTEREAVSSAVATLFEKHGDDRLRAIACAILDRLSDRHGVDYEYSTAKEVDSEAVADEQPVEEHAHA